MRAEQLLSKQVTAVAIQVDATMPQGCEAGSVASSMAPKRGGNSKSGTAETEHDESIHNLSEPIHRNPCGNAHRVLTTLVPNRSQHHKGGRNGTFGQTEKESSSHQTRKVTGETDTNAGHAPDYDRAAYKGPQRQAAKKVCGGPVGQ
ncbi:hypothetical protein HG530_007794 [Fusarium avenaceum]|nr:hypothetical protein HG530_007794 [Fusarium avenaceum]